MGRMSALRKALVVPFWLSLAAAVLLALTMTARDWLKNPGSIFRDDSGTRWDFVADTFFSWFVPALLVLTLLLPAVYLVVGVLIKTRNRNDKGEGVD